MVDLINCDMETFKKWVKEHEPFFKNKYPKIVHSVYYEYISGGIGFQITLDEFLDYMDYLHECDTFSYKYIGLGVTEYYLNNECVLRKIEYGEIE